MPSTPGPARAVIFDADDVLVDSYRARCEAWKAMGRRLGQELTKDRFAATDSRRHA